MIPIKLITDRMLRIDLFNDFVSIVLNSCCKNDHFEKFTDFFQEFLSERPNMENLFIIIIMNESFIEIKDEEILFLGWRQIRETGHF